MTKKPRPLLGPQSYSNFVLTRHTCVVVYSRFCRRLLRTSVSSWLRQECQMRPTRRDSFIRKIQGEIAKRN